MNQGIEKDNLIQDISKLDYQNIEINKELRNIYNIKKELEKNYTSPINQEDINDSLNKKIDLLNTNRNNEIELLKDKVIEYNKVTKETEKIFDKVETNIVIK